MSKITKRYNQARNEAAGLTGAARREVVGKAKNDLQRQFFGTHPMFHFISQLILTAISATFSLFLGYSIYEGVRMPIIYVLFFAGVFTMLAGLNSISMLWPLVKEKSAKGNRKR